MAYVKERLQPADVKKALAKDMVTKVGKADQLMVQWRTMLEGAGVDMSSHEVMMALGFADIAMAAHALSIRLVGEKTYKSMEGLAHDFVKMINGMVGTNMTSPWDQWEEVDASSTPTAAKIGNMDLREVDKDGKITNMGSVLASHGFNINDHVKRKSDGQEGQIDMVDQDGVVKIRIPNEQNKLAKVKLADLLNGDWIKYTPQSDPVILDQVDQHDAYRGEAWKRQVQLAKLILFLSAQAEKHHSLMDGKLQLQLRPSKNVECMVRYAKGKLILTPIPSGMKPANLISICVSLSHCAFHACCGISGRTHTDPAGFTALKHYSKLTYLG